MGVVRRWGSVSALALALFEFLYVAVLVSGLVALESQATHLYQFFFP